MRKVVVALVLYLLVNVHAAGQCPGARENPLPLPSSIKPENFVAYEKQIFEFLDTAQFEKLGWCVDKRIRDTGPWINNTPYNTHKSVLIYYSPGIIAWLTGRSRTIPDRAMMVKVQFDAPAARYENSPPDTTNKDWTIMIRDSSATHDGWFWGEFYTGMSFDDHQYPFNYPNAGFGLYCVRCHASAARERTFASLTNIKGFPGVPITFRVDDSWRTPPAATPLTLLHRAFAGHAPAEQQAPALPPVETVNELFLQTFPQIQPVPTHSVQHIPNETYDLTPPPLKPQLFLTSTQCQGCHSAATQTQPFGPTMFLPFAPPAKGGINVSEYTEWRWSPMGLGGRDPIFYAQLDSELSWLRTVKPESTSKSLQQAVQDTCFRCHGVLGKRQMDVDKPGSHFTEQIPFETSGPNAQYGALARDGVSCLSCHHIERTKTPSGENELQYFLAHSITGLFPTGKAEEIFGPFKDNEIVTKPMNNAFGADPKFNEYMKSSRLCGTCHTIDLPVVDKPPIEPISPNTPKAIEQATYLEWLNSDYQDELGKHGATPRSCQSCHMPGAFVSTPRKIDVPQVQTRIALIEDDSYPAAEHILPTEDITVRYRETGFARHELLGLNDFLLEMFSQFNDILGVRKNDYMTGSADVLENVQANMIQQARSSTAKVGVAMQRSSDCGVIADVTVENLTGHRLPSGVGFRRLFLEVEAVQTVNGRERVVWASGHTNAVGVIVDADGKPLATEFFNDGKFEEHHETINSQSQVQIYQELTKNADDEFTTSFIRRDEEVKDNRLLPHGYTFEGPDPASLSGRFLEATHPKGAAAKDPDYQNTLGKDTTRYCITLPAGVDPSTIVVRATLWSQSIPPFYLKDRFTIGTGPATQRLYFIASNLEVEDTEVDSWKLRVAQGQGMMNP